MSGTPMPAARQSPARLMLALWSMVALLLLLSHWLTSLPELWLRGLTVLVTLPITGLLFWRRRLHRWAFRRAVMNPASRYYSSFIGGPVMFLLQAGLAAALSAALLVGLARLASTLFWVVLVIMVPLWVYTHHWLEYRLAAHLEARFVRLVALRIQAICYGGALMFLMLVWSLYQPVDDLRGVSIETAVLAFTAGAQANSVTLQALLEVIAAFDALRHWLVQNLAPTVPGLLLALLAWTMVLVREWLLIWPLLLLLQAVQVIVEGGWVEQVRQTGSPPAP